MDASAPQTTEKRAPQPTWAEIIRLRALESALRKAQRRGVLRGVFGTLAAVTLAGAAAVGADYWMNSREGAWLNHIDSREIKTYRRAGECAQSIEQGAAISYLNPDNYALVPSFATPLPLLPEKTLARKFNECINARLAAEKRHFRVLLPGVDALAPGQP